LGGAARLDLLRLKRRSRWLRTVGESKLPTVLNEVGILAQLFELSFVQLDQVFYFGVDGGGIDTTALGSNHTFSDDRQTVQIFHCIRISKIDRLMPKLFHTARPRSRIRPVHVGVAV
jgi:hypothetical protein